MIIIYYKFKYKYKFEHKYKFEQKYKHKARSLADADSASPWFTRYTSSLKLPQMMVMMIIVIKDGILDDDDGVKCSLTI